jgi:chromosome segregation ATPase
MATKYDKKQQEQVDEMSRLIKVAEERYAAIKAELDSAERDLEQLRRGRRSFTRLVAAIQARKRLPEDVVQAWLKSLTPECPALLDVVSETKGGPHNRPHRVYLRDSLKRRGMFVAGSWGSSGRLTELGMDVLALLHEEVSAQKQENKPQDA